MPTGWFAGLATLDVVQLVDRLPSPDRKTVAERSWLAAGGPATVAAIAFAALGGRAVLVTALGDGAAAELVRSDLVSAGVAVIDLAPPGFELAPSTALVDAGSGRRAVVSGSGHRPASLLPLPGLPPAEVLLLDGHHPGLALPLARTAATAGMPVVVDAGSHKPVLDELWPLVSDVICSADYVDPSGRAPSDLLALGPELVAVSHGPGPLRWWTAGTSGSVEVAAVDAVDTLGAGDVLHGGYAFALAEGAPRPDALAFGVEAATRRVTRLGPFEWRAALGLWSGSRPAGQGSGQH